MFQFSGKITVGQTGYFTAGHTLFPLFHNIQLLGNGKSCVQMVAGNHNGGNACFTAGADGFCGFGPGRVLHTHKAQKGKRLFHGTVPVPFHGDGKGAQRLGGHVFHCISDFPPHFLGQGKLFVVEPYVGAAI